MGSSATRLAPVLFAGLAPGYPGVAQINVSIPRDAPTGRDLTLIVSHGLLRNVLRVAVE